MYTSTVLEQNGNKGDYYGNKGTLGLIEKKTEIEILPTMSLLMNSRQNRILMKF